MGSGFDNLTIRPIFKLTSPKLLLIFGMSPWKRTLFGCQVYAGLNLSTRSRYFKGLKNPQPFAGTFNAPGKGRDHL